VHEQERDENGSFWTDLVATTHFSLLLVLPLLLSSYQPLFLAFIMSVHGTILDKNDPAKRLPCDY